MYKPVVVNLKNFSQQYFDPDSLLRPLISAMFGCYKAKTYLWKQKKNNETKKFQKRNIVKAIPDNLFPSAIIYSLFVIVGNVGEHN